MEKITINKLNYELVRNNGNCFNKDDIENLLTEYFEKFDYVLGDYAYDKLRLKGFYDKTNKNVSKINNILDVDGYIRDFCAYEGKYFLLKKIN